MIPLLDVFRARKRIAPYVRRTPLVASAWLSEAANAEVRLKLESLQVTSSFKSRGAFNAVIARLERVDGAPRSLVTASAGNHGRALAEAASAFHLRLTVFTPRDAPYTKLAAIRRLGAELRAEARNYDEAERLAQAYARDSEAEFISGYSDLDVITGAATIGLEILEDAPGVAMIVIPVGGGGLTSGVASAMRAIDPNIDVVGVEVEASCAFQTSLRAGRLVPIVPGPTLADGLAGNPDPDTITWNYIRRLVTRIVTVTEDDLRQAIAGLAGHEHIIAEGAGAAGVAALMGGQAGARGRRVAAIVSGANIDPATLASVID